MKKHIITLAIAITIYGIAIAQKMNTPNLVKADNKPIDIRIGWVGQTMYDLTKDGLKDLIVGDVFGELRLFKNIGTKGNAVFSSAVSITADDNKRLIHNW